MYNQKYIHADNIEYLRTLADNSVDSVVTDAPYGLGKEPDVIEMLNAWITVGYLEVSGTGFMGKKWDAFVPQPNFWKEVIRVLKPGGHVLCFFGTRTYDWGVMAMRLAGFEVRDQLQWIYGSGFPKSLNISKAIDKEAGVERDVIGDSSGPNNKKYEGDRYKEKRFTKFGVVQDQPDMSIPSTEEAKKWDGYGTALKPANEPIVLARKPIEKGLTIAENVLKWGTGGLNIDACRIKFSSESDKKSAIFGRGTNIIGGNYVGATHSDGRENIEPDDKGRFPANIMFDEEAARMLDEQSGRLTSGAPSGTKNGTSKNVFSDFGSIPVTGYGDTGGASRFFYVAKPSKAERNQGLENFVKKENKHASYGIHTDEGLINNGRNPENRSRETQNFHPTVKPIRLMQYLVHMVTPIGGKCIDPFNGSGPTGIACGIEDIEYEGIDNEEDYIMISQARADSYKSEINNQLGLFDE